MAERPDRRKEVKKKPKLLLPRINMLTWEPKIEDIRDALTTTARDKQ